jgi:hypothetical protein
MNLKTKFLALLFASLSFFNLNASESQQSEIQKVLYCVDWIKTNKYTTYKDFENELNFKTIDAPADEKYEFSEDEISFTKKNNLYCTEIYLKGINDRMLAMLQVEGSGCFPYLKIFRFNSKKQKWTIYYSGKGSLGECGLAYPIKDPLTGYTFFLEEIRNFDNKRLISYNLLSFNNKKFKVIASAHAHYVYNLSTDEKQWIDTDIIEKIAAFDYSFLGIEKDHPEIIEREYNDKKVSAKLYYTSVGRIASNFDITISKMAREVFKKEEKIFEEEKELLKLGSGWWGLNFIEKDNTLYLVYIGMGNSGWPTIENFQLNVINLSTLKTIYSSYIKCDIIFE